MKEILIILFIFIGMLKVNAISLPTTDTERRISVILDTLDNPYYWRSIPEDFMGRIPDEPRPSYPHREKLYQYKGEIDKLLDQKERNISNYVGNLGSGERFEKGRNRFWRDSAKDAHRYYDKNKVKILDSE